MSSEVPPPEPIIRNPNPGIVYRMRCNAKVPTMVDGTFTMLPPCGRVDYSTDAAWATSMAAFERNGWRMAQRHEWSCPACAAKWTDVEGRPIP